VVVAARAAPPQAAGREPGRGREPAPRPELIAEGTPAPARAPQPQRAEPRRIDLRQGTPSATPRDPRSAGGAGAAPAASAPRAEARAMRPSAAPAPAPAPAPGLPDLDASGVALRGLPRDAAVEAGHFSTRSAIGLIYQLALDQADGLLRVERDGVVKEAHFVRGHPQFIRSNVPTERLGEYLVKHGVITDAELARAVSVLPHFGGRLGDTLVGLKLMRPLDAFHYLTRQVRDKLVDVATWDGGGYWWYAGHHNPWPSLQLHLDSFEIIGAGASQLPRSFVMSWAHPRSDHTPIAAKLPLIELSQFQLGERLDYVCGLLDGRSTLRNLVRRFAQADDRVDFLRLLHLLTETELARFDR
jgi:hypothetical protein